jgi:tetratricopeptide (TPR) repeat protein
METPVNSASGFPKPRERKPSGPIRPGGPPKCGPAKSGEALLSGLPVLAAAVGILGFPHGLGPLWFILPALLVVAVWFALAAYADRLATRGRYDQALRIAPFVAVSAAGRSYLRGDVLTDAGRYEEAERLLRDAIGRVGAMKVDIGLALEDLGNVLMDTGRFEEAQQCFQRAAGIYPKRTPAASGMAEVFLRQGIYPQNALPHAERALDLFRSGDERFSNRWRLGGILAIKAWALAACGRGAEAREAIDAALKSPARKTKGPLAQVHYNAGMTLLALSDRQGAREHFARGAALDPAGRWGRLCARVRPG